MAIIYKTPKTAIEPKLNVSWIDLNSNYTTFEFQFRSACVKWNGINCILY